MTENQEKTIDPPEEVPPIEWDTGKIQEQAQKQAANIDGLIKLLETGRLLDRTKVADILGEIGDERGVLPLIGAMKDPSTDVQYVAIKSLGMIADPRAVDPLIMALTSPEKWVRRGAARALGKIGDARAIGPLQLLLQDPKKDVHTEAETALELLGVKKSS